MAQKKHSHCTVDLVYEKVGFVTFVPVLRDNGCVKTV